MVEDMSLEGFRENWPWMKSNKEELFQSSTVVTTANNKVVQKRECISSHKAVLYYFWNRNIIQNFLSSFFSLPAFPDIYISFLYFKFVVSTFIIIVINMD